MTRTDAQPLRRAVDPLSVARSLWFEHRRYVWAALRGCLLGYLVLDVLIGLALMPRSASVADLRRDLASGTVTSLAVDGAGTGGRFTPYTWSRMSYGGSTSTAVLWHPGGWRPSVVVLPNRVDRDGVPTGLPTIQRRAEAAGVRMTYGSLDVASREQRTFPVVILGLLATLVIGQQPRRATRWAWLWLLPWNVGLVWWVLREHPWSERMRLTAQPPRPRERRPGDLRTRAGPALTMLALGSVLAALLTGGRDFPLG